MIIPLRYGESKYDLDVPEQNLRAVLTPAQIPPCDLAEALSAARPPKDFLAARHKLLIVINDSFRSTPSQAVLDDLLPGLQGHPAVRVMIATGLHSAPTQKEQESLLGRHYPEFGSRIGWSDSRAREDFERIGAWPDGGEIYLHKRYGWADRVIIIGSVEPHYFAGFTGGIKSLIPGLSYCKTIERNHQKAVDPGSQPGVTQGNPVWETLWETARYLDQAKIHSYQLVQDSDHRVVGLFGGDLFSSYQRAVDLCRRIYIKSISSPVDLLVAEHSPPLDRNLYQLQKCFENTKTGVADGGNLLMLSACREGVGAGTLAFFELADRYPRPEQILQAGNTESSLGVHKLYRTALLTRRIRLRLMSSLPEEQVRKIYIEPVMDANAQIREMLNRKPSLSILVVKDAGHLALIESPQKMEESHA